jgi:hypothetical protein
MNRLSSYAYCFFNSLLRSYEISTVMKKPSSSFGGEISAFQKEVTTSLWAFRRRSSNKNPMRDCARRAVLPGPADKMYVRSFYRYQPWGSNRKWTTDPITMLLRSASDPTPRMQKTSTLPRITTSSQLDPASAKLGYPQLMKQMPSAHNSKIFRTLLTGERHYRSVTQSGPSSE